VLTLFLRLTANPARSALFNRWAPIIVLVIAAVLRLYDLAYPNVLVFDETYYVKDAYSLIHSGHESNWSSGADSSFANGSPSGLTDQPSFVVHPPLGKWIIGLGMWIFGAGNPFGWRVMVALAGIAAVWFTMACAKLIFRSTIWSVLAGLLFAIDGVGIVLSRTALLDQILGFFVILGFYFFLKDREQVRFGTWRRPWLLAMSISLGLASAVKWSGLYFLVVLLAYIIVSEANLNFKIHRVIEENVEDKFTHRFWLVPSIFQALRSAVMVLVPSLLAYLLSWSGWFFTKGGWDRTWAYESGHALTGWLWWVPKSLQSLWHYHEEIYSFHVNLHAAHPYASSPFTWPFMLRPTSFFWDDKVGGTVVSAITALGNPIIWWSAVLAAGVLYAAWFRTRDKTTTIISVGLIAGYVPWMLLTNRTVFEFYVVAFEPWVILLLVAGLRSWFRNTEYRYRTANFISGFALLSILVSAFFYPIWTGAWISYEFWHWRMWLPSWI
jgi:dolichyl-phosphate-mannose--protein O-mannosyl transferase